MQRVLACRSARAYGGRRPLDWASRPVCVPDNRVLACRAVRMRVSEASGRTERMSTEIVARGLDQLGTLLARVGPDDTASPTPCSDWTVADLSDHIVNSTAGMVLMARGEQPDWANAAHHDDPAAAFRAEADALVVALDGGEFPVGMAAAELAVHAYDLATGLGVGTSDLDPEVAETGHAFMSSSLTADKRGDAFGPEQSAPDGADAYQRIAAFAGRAV